MAITVSRRLLTVEEFYRMAEAGVFAPEERLELVDGELITMPAMGPRHNACLILFNREFSRRIGDAALVCVQGPLALDASEVRYPDIALLRPQADAYRTSGPTARDALLVVEVSDTSIGYDREIKVPRYARAGVRETWIADLTTNGLEVYRSPERGHYAAVRRLGRSDSIAPEAFPDLVIALDAVLLS